jgi:hypothetical protein
LGFFSPVVLVTRHLPSGIGKRITPRGIRGEEED